MRKLIWIAVVAAALAFSGQAMAADGAKIFASKCAMCHGQGGAGTSMAPKLAGNAFVKGDAAAVKEAISKGRSGAAKKYSNFPIAMPAFGSQLSGAELDAVVKYLQSL